MSRVALIMVCCPPWACTQVQTGSRCYQALRMPCRLLECYMEMKSRWFLDGMSKKVVHFPLALEGRRNCAMTWKIAVGVSTRIVAQLVAKQSMQVPHDAGVHEGRCCLRGTCECQGIWLG
mmetsp:Transcript_119546/g.238165  ORF Transcript_119546/g.238165 Transcript_119546/m.238165 type:complete len:120 (-) Transcript_119546:226-585(-)